MHTIHVAWDGPLPYDAALKLTGGSDYGIYQIYGRHHVFGSDCLLYIGSAEAKTFGERLNQHELFDWCTDTASVAVYVGRLVGLETPQDSEWARDLLGVESLLIFAHTPPWNSRNIQTYKHDFRERFHVANWGSRGALLPELTSLMWASSSLRPPPGLRPYGEAQRRSSTSEGRHDADRMSGSDRRTEPCT